MSHLPLYVISFGRLRHNKIFQEIDLKLGSVEGGRRRIYPVLSFRFWCHAHIYSPVFSLILGYIIGDYLSQITGDYPGSTALTVLADKRALTLLMLSLGSLSFAVCDSFGGAYADRNGCKSAMKLGIKWMAGLMVLFAAISLFSNELKFFAVILAAIGQILVGFPLALIDGADTQLTKTISRQVKGLTEADGDHLEGICTQLKYSGLAVASFVGCLIYVMASA